MEKNNGSLRRRRRRRRPGKRAVRELEREVRCIPARGQGSRGGSMRAVTIIEFRQLAPHALGLSSIQYHRLRQAQGEGHDTLHGEGEGKVAHLRLTLHHSMSIDVHYLTECWFRTSCLPNTLTHPAAYVCVCVYIHGQCIRSRKTRVEEGRTLENERGAQDIAQPFIAVRQ